jgi:hypothetical protein
MTPTLAQTDFRVRPTAAGTSARASPILRREYALAPESLAKIARVVEHEYNWAQPMPTELADLLSGHLVRTFAGNQDQSTLRSADRGPERRWSRPSD